MYSPWDFGPSNLNWYFRTTFYVYCDILSFVGTIVLGVGFFVVVLIIIVVVVVVVVVVNFSVWYIIPSLPYY